MVNEKKEMKGILWDISREEWAKFSLLYPKRQILSRKKKKRCSSYLDNTQIQSNTCSLQQAGKYHYSAIQVFLILKDIAHEIGA